MGIFVDEEKDYIKLSVYYLIDDKNKISVDPADSLTEAEKDGRSLLTIDFRIPDWDDTQVVKRNSTIVSENGFSVDFQLFMNNLFIYLSDGWNVKDENGEEVKFNKEKLGQLRPEIVRCFLDLIQTKFAEIGIFDSLLLS